MDFIYQVKIIRSGNYVNMLKSDEWYFNEVL